jgi:phosphodiester glycosidase
MPVARRLAALLGLSAPLILLSSHPVSQQGQPLSPSAAHAQGAPAPSRIELYLPPARITSPVPLPLPTPRPAPAAVVRDESTWHSLGEKGDSPSPPSYSAPRPGLFTVARMGRRLVYRKGYLSDVPIHLVVADLNDPDVKLGVMVARGGIGTTESFAGMIHRARPAAAITGTFFGVHNGLPTGDLVVNGHALYQGFVGTAVAFTRGNLVSFIPMGYKEKTAWRFFDGVLRAGPMLVQAAKIAVSPRDEGFVSLSPAARRQRTAVGITSGRKLLLLAVKEPISLWRLAKLMRSLGAYHAVAMDGGSSTGLYFHGQMVVRPARALTNALVIYARQEQYQQARGSLLGRSRAPAAAPRTAPAAPAIAIEIQPAADGSAGDPTAVGNRAQSIDASPGQPALTGTDQALLTAPSAGGAAQRSLPGVTGPGPASAPVPASKEAPPSAPPGAG